MRRPAVAPLRARDLAADLATIEAGGPTCFELLADALPRLGLFDLSIAYDLARDERGLAFATAFIVSDDDPRFRDEFERALRTRPDGLLAYDPLRPQASQRNRALNLEGLARAGASPGRFATEGFPRLGLAKHDQLRALVCDGPVLLAWVGGFRRAPFDEGSVALLQELVPAIRRRLLLERDLSRAQLSSAGLVAALEAIGVPAYVVRFDARGVAVELANAAGREALEREGTAVRAALRHALAGGPDAAFEVTRLPLAGARDHALCVHRPVVEPAAARLAAARARFRLTPRQCDVLARLARGAANKTIAADLGIAEGTVELNVTQLFAKVGVASRSELVARFWTFEQRRD